MSVFETAIREINKTDHIDMFTNPNTKLSYQPRPFAFFEYRIVKYPQTDAQKKDCASFILVPLLGILRLENAQWLSKIMPFFDLLFRNFYNQEVTSPFVITRNRAGVATSMRMFRLGATITTQCKELVYLAAFYVFYNILLFFVNLTALSWDSLITFNLMNPLRKTPKDDFHDYQGLFLYLCAFVYILSIISLQKTEIPEARLERPVLQQNPAIQDDEVEEDEEEANDSGEEEADEAEEEGEADEEEGDDEADDSGEEEEVDGEDDGEEQDSEEDEEEDEEEFIQCDRREENDAQPTEEEVRKMEMQQILMEKEKFGQIVNPTDDLPILFLCQREQTFETRRVTNASPFAAIQWPHDNQTHKRLVLTLSNAWLSVLISAIIHKVFISVLFSFFPRLFYSILLQFSGFKFLIHLIFLEDGHFWIAKALCILIVQILMNYHKIGNEVFTPKHITVQIAKNTLMNYIFSLFISDYYNWAVIDMLHLTWILQW